jgi:hypothetical protein
MTWTAGRRYSPVTPAYDRRRPAGLRSLGALPVSGRFVYYALGRPQERADLAQPCDASGAIGARRAGWCPLRAGPIRASSGRHRRRVRVRLGPFRENLKCDVRTLTLLRGSSPVRRLARRLRPGSARRKRRGSRRTWDSGRTRRGPCGADSSGRHGCVASAGGGARRCSPAARPGTSRPDG